MSFARTQRKGFTLIELLVVVSIIALLISILLPALGEARKAAWKTRSQANIRQILIGCAAYRHDHRGFYPITPSYHIARYPSLQPLTKGQIQPTSKHHVNWCTWSAWGKNNDGYWARFGSTSATSMFDWEAADRPANQYIHDDPGSLYAPKPPNVLPPDSEYRKLERLIFRDPSDQVSYVRRIFSSTNSELSMGGSYGWFYSQIPKEGPAAMSAYNDTGTSYQWNAKWFVSKVFQTHAQKTYLGQYELFLYGMSQLRNESEYSPSRFVITHDQYADVTANNTQSSSMQVRNGYGEINRSAMGFGDGHAAYQAVSPGADAGGYANENAAFTFEFLRPKK